MNLLRLTLFLGLLHATYIGQGTEVGDPAPPLQVKQWVKGEPVELKGGAGKVYLVDFWATWSPACQASIAFLTELQQQFKAQGVVVIGIADESLPAVKPMVEEMGAKMLYSVGIDDKHQTSESYLRTYGTGGIPHTFLIDQNGKVVWHGHPMSELRSVLIKVLTKNFDARQARLASEIEKQGARYLEMAASDKLTSQMLELGNTLLKEAAGKPELLNHLAWSVLSTPTKGQDLDFAQNAAKAAFEATQGREPAITDTYARAVAEKGDLAAAVKLQEQAVEAAAKGPQKEQMQKTLEAYQKKLAAATKPKAP